LTKKDFTIPEGWQDEKMRKSREKIIAAFGPKLVQEILDSLLLNL